jgi:hypothetical protein
VRADSLTARLGAKLGLNRRRGDERDLAADGVTVFRPRGRRLWLPRRAFAPADVSRLMRLLRVPEVEAG